MDLIIMPARASASLAVDMGADRSMAVAIGADTVAMEFRLDGIGLGPPYAQRGTTFMRDLASADLNATKAG